MTPDELGKQDIAVMNLRAATGLRGSHGLDVAHACRTLDRWAKAVEEETRKYLPQYHRKPSEYENSEGYFRMLTLITVLQQDLGVRYNPQRINDPDFTNSRDLFLHGMIGSSNGGTCVSMPVLYTAVARRLRYPIHLVLAKGHVFCRWEDDTERFNIEATGVGMNKFADEYYRKWPEVISDVEMDRGVFLKNLTPREELAVFLSARGASLEDTGLLADAYLAYAHAYALGKNPDDLVALSIALRKTLIPLAHREGTLPNRSDVRQHFADMEQLQRINEYNRRISQPPATDIYGRTPRGAIPTTPAVGPANAIPPGVWTGAAPQTNPLFDDLP